jgi:hypothetical protein
VGEPPKMWGSTIVGFGTVHYKYESGREGDICPMGFSPRSGGLVQESLNTTRSCAFRRNDPSTRTEPAKPNDSSAFNRSRDRPSFVLLFTLTSLGDS